MQEKKCSEKVREQYQGRLDDFLKAQKYFNIEKSKRPQNDDFESYEDFFDYVNQYGLCFDFVSAGTFTDQKSGYWRFQMSFGGPSDEFRIYTDYEKNIHYIEYWFLDWFDGANITINDDVIFDICRSFLECSEHPEPEEYEKEVA
jgi:hypothetical protein